MDVDPVSLVCANMPDHTAVLRNVAVLGSEDFDALLGHVNALPILEVTRGNISLPLPVIRDDSIRRGSIGLNLLQRRFYSVAIGEAVLVKWVRPTPNILRSVSFDVRQINLLHTSVQTSAISGELQTQLQGRYISLGEPLVLRIGTIFVRLEALQCRAPLAPGNPITPSTSPASNQPGNDVVDVQGGFLTNVTAVMLQRREEPMVLS